MASILLIEDMDGVRTSIEMILKGDGHRVITAADGEEGLTRAVAERFDLIITDVLMPRKDGVEVIFALREAPNPPPILAISGGEARLPADRALQLAEPIADATLEKPFSKGELLETIHGLLQDKIAASR